jgi:hypothetical protein
MMPVPAVEMQLNNISKVRNTYAITDSRIAVIRYMESD